MSDNWNDGTVEGLQDRIRELEANLEDAQAIIAGIRFAGPRVSDVVDLAIRGRKVVRALAVRDAEALALDAEIAAKLLRPKPYDKHEHNSHLRRGERP